MKKLMLVAAALTIAASCKPAQDDPVSALQAGSTTPVTAVREGDRTVRVFGGWPVSGESLSAAGEFVRAHAPDLGVPDGVEFGEPRSLDADGDVISIDLLYDGSPVFGGEVRVRILGEGADRRIVTVAVSSPGGFSDKGATVEAGDAAATAEADGMRRSAEPALVWLSTGMLFGEREDAHLAWRVPVRHPDTARPATRWIDATDGTMVWDQPEVAHLIDVRDADQDGGRFRIIGDDQDALTRLVYRDGELQAGATADPEAMAARDIAGQACARMHQAFGEPLPCDQFEVYVDIGPDPATADMPMPTADPNDAYATCLPDDRGFCDNSILGFGATALQWQSARQTFEHEMWHAFVERTVPLARSGEPAAVNEAVADLNAVFATRPGSTWIMGIGNAGEADFQKARNLTEPSDTNHPSHRNQLRVTTVAEWEQAHANSVILSHGMWKAVEQGGVVNESTEWAPIPYAQAEQILYLATKNGPGKTATLRRAAENMVVECVLAVIDARQHGKPGNPAHGLRQEHCGALANAFAEVGLVEQDRDVDGLWDSNDPCPDRQDVLHLWNYDDESDCEPPPPSQNTIEDLCPETLETSRGTATRGEVGGCDFAVENKAGELGHQCVGCMYATAGGDEAFLQISTTSEGPRDCQPLATIDPHVTFTPLRGKYVAVGYGWVAEEVDEQQVGEIVPQLEPELSDYAADCMGSAFEVEDILSVAPLPSVESGERGNIQIRFAGDPQYPVTARLPIDGECDAAFDCTEIEAMITQDDVNVVGGSVRSYDWVGAIRCIAPTSGIESASVAVQLVDAAGTVSAVDRFSDQCAP